MRPRPKETPTSATVRLPQITKGSSQEATPTMPTSAIRPASSSSKVQELQKKLFTQLENIGKGERKKAKKTLGMSMNSQVTKNIESCKDIKGETGGIFLMDSTGLHHTDLSSQSSHYLSVLNRVSELRKTLVPRKLDETVSSSLAPNVDSGPFLTNFATQQPSKMEEYEDNAEISISPQGTGVSSGKKGQEQSSSTSLPPSFSLADAEMERIYAQYCASEGLQVETSVSELQEMNKHIRSCEKQIKGLEKSYGAMIAQIGQFCVTNEAAQMGQQESHD